jgi:hypothetical protein
MILELAALWTRRGLESFVPQGGQIAFMDRD